MSTTATEIAANLAAALKAENDYDEVLDDWHAAGCPMPLENVRGFAAARDAHYAAYEALTDDERAIWLSDEFFASHRAIR